MFEKNNSVIVIRFFFSLPWILFLSLIPIFPRVVRNLREKTFVAPGLMDIEMSSIKSTLWGLYVSYTVLSTWHTSLPIILPINERELASPGWISPKLLSYDLILINLRTLRRARPPSHNQLLVNINNYIFSNHEWQQDKIKSMY